MTRPPDGDPPTDCADFDAAGLDVRLDLEVPARVGAIDGVVRRVLVLVRDGACAVGREFEVETALREALANAIVHGCGGDPQKKVQVCAACDDERGILIVVRDPGPGFDPASLPSPVVGERLWADHGRGVYLINRLMDEVRFSRGGTEIRMRKR